VFGAFYLGELTATNLLEYFESIVRGCALAQPSLSHLVAAVGSDITGVWRDP